MKSLNFDNIWWFPPGTYSYHIPHELDGWYFSDETEQLVGPYPTEKEASDSLIAYVKQL